MSNKYILDKDSASKCLADALLDVRLKYEKMGVIVNTKFENTMYGSSTSSNSFNPASKDNGLRFQDVDSRMYDEQPIQVHSSNRSSIQQQSSREASLDRLVRNIDCSDTQSGQHGQCSSSSKDRSAMPIVFDQR